MAVRNPNDIRSAYRGAALYAKAQVDPVEYLYFLWLRDHGLVPALLVRAPLSYCYFSAYSHGGWLHLLGNMVSFVFDNIEARLGTTRYVMFYFAWLGGISGASGWVASQCRSLGRQGQSLGCWAYLVMFPKAR